MKKADKTEWTVTRITNDTLDKVKAKLPRDRSISQERFIDDLVLKGLSHTE